jgi:hypothetical protein
MRIYEGYLFSGVKGDEFALEHARAVGHRTSASAISPCLQSVLSKASPSAVVSMGHQGRVNQTMHSMGDGGKLLGDEDPLLSAGYAVSMQLQLGGGGGVSYWRCI